MYLFHNPTTLSSPRPSQSFVPPTSTPTATTKSPTPTFSQFPQPQTQSQTPPPQFQPYSCLLCKSRKLKCTRIHPCSNCVKANANAGNESVQCVFRAPPPPRRKKRVKKEATKGKELGEKGLRERLKSYEELLRGMGVDVEEVSGEVGGKVDSVSREGEGVAALSLDEGKEGDVVMREANDGGGEKRAETGRLISEEGRSRYLENNLWTSVSDELHDSREILQEASDDENTDVPVETPSFGPLLDGADLVLGFYSPDIDLHALHPQPMHILRLWQTFLDNVNPLTKFIHAPTMQKEVFEATGHTNGISKSMEVLLFAIYSIAVASLSDEECGAMLGETKQVLQAKYQFATKQALLQAEFLKSSDMAALQAFTLFLLSVRLSYDPRSFWTITGIAIRSGQRIGLHRDGSTLGLPPFQTEMRRRLWWQILLIDGRAAELAGAGVSILHHLTDTKTPLNVNDSDLYPDMQASPREHTGATEMIFCLLRYEFGEFLRHSNFKNAFDGSWQNLSSATVAMSEKDKAINKLEKILENKFVKYCDPRIPLHALCVGVAKAGISRMRLVAHHPKQYAARGQPIPKVVSDMLFPNVLQMIEFDNLGHSTKSNQRFLWHGNAHFQWHALIYILGELRVRVAGEDVDEAWRQLDDLFDHHSHFMTAKKSLNAAIATLALKAYKAREAHLARQPQVQLPEGWPPQFIATLASRKSHFNLNLASETATPSNIDYYGPTPSGVPQFANQPETAQPPVDADGLLDVHFLTDPMMPLDQTPIDWEAWDSLLQDFQWQGSV